MAKITAPFTPQQVAALNDYQGSGRMHPFTCDGSGCTETQPLVATEEGWVCPCGKYKQNWAHGFMAESKKQQQ